MLEVCLELGFPVFVLERSPFVLRDLDLLQAIHAKARVAVAFSIISTPDSPYYEQVHQIERLAPSVEKRFATMQKLAEAGIPTGVCAMPILPGLCDKDENLADLVHWTAEHGGQFILAGGLTLADQQRDYFFTVLNERFPDLATPYQRLYPPGSYSPSGWDWPKLAMKLRELCQLAGIRDRMPRPIISGEKRALNKRVVELLANECYSLEIQRQSPQRVWAYRKAAWAIEDLEQDIGLVYAQMGVKGLASIPNVGPGVARQVEQWIGSLKLSSNIQ
jgi:DNA repair photolyase